MNLLDYDPRVDRQQSLWNGLLALGPAIAAAGMAQTDPGARMRLLMQGAQNFGANQNAYMRGARADRMGELQMAEAKRKMTEADQQAQARARLQARLTGATDFARKPGFQGGAPAVQPGSVPPGQQIALASSSEMMPPLDLGSLTASAVGATPAQTDPQASPKTAPRPPADFRSLMNDPAVMADMMTLDKDPSSLIRSYAMLNSPTAGLRHVGGTLYDFSSGVPQVVVSAPERPERFGRPLTVAGVDGKPALVQPSSRGGVVPVEGFGPRPPNQTPERFGRPMPMVGEDGQQQLVQPGNRGTMQPVPGFTPQPRPQARGGAPFTRKRTEGDELITEEYSNGAWSEVSRAPRAARPERTGPSASSAAYNDEIQAARKYITGMSLAPDDLKRRTQSTTGTGRDNPDYDPSLSRMMRLATKRLRGMGDPDFEKSWSSIYGGGSASAAPAPSRPQPGAQPSELPMANGRVDSTKLQIGSVYSVRGGPRLRWTGKEFEEIQ